jgi:murein L,D-transpeptidase YcbB/YkuD
MTGSALAGGLVGMPLGALGGYYIGDQLASNQRATEIQLREKDMEIQRLRRENERLRREEDLPERGARLSRSEAEPERQASAAPERQARVDPAQSEPQRMTASRQAVSATPEQVRQVQRKLNETGYNSGGVDGIWGPRTEAAVRNFQRAKGLQVTGRLNEQTLQALGVDEAGQSAQTSGEAQETRSEEPSQKNRQNP